MPLLFFDIEIARDTSVSPDLYDQAKLKHPEQYMFLPAYNKVIALAIGGTKQGVYTSRSLVGSEKEMIEEFFNILLKNQYILVGYNILQFDIPFLVHRAMHYSIPIPPLLQTYNVKPWDLTSRFIDLMQALKSTGSRYYSLADACLLLSIPSSKTSIDGSQVQEAYDNGRLDEITTYCLDDVRATYDLYQKLTALKLLT